MKMKIGSKKVFAVLALVLVAVISVTVLWMIHHDADGECIIAKDGSYVIINGERYVPVTSEPSENVISRDKVIAENVPVENGDFFDRYFIYGYIVYGSDTDSSVIYVHTAESSGFSGYYVKDMLPS